MKSCVQPTADNTPQSQNSTAQLRDVGEQPAVEGDAASLFSSNTASIASGTSCVIVDWDQLPNGLLGITIEGGQRFHVDDVWRESSGLNRARVDVEPWPEPVVVPQEGVSMIDVLAGLQRHPEVKRLGLSLDTGNAWEVCHVLTQLLPIENSVKYELLGLTDITRYIDQLDVLLSEMSG